MAAELMLPLDRDCLVAAILTSNTQGLTPQQAVQRYQEMLGALLAQKGSYTLWSDAFNNHNKS